ncbi:hypothetical protein NC653_041929 [Populus alba x Populus x berolinensis]|uniref:Uncharacterized protein n=1 Tax=Populus alba x Populus x berolinensis TaxID=444605 RepID=A0AAD6LC88_9ROSI|nr:hypothetical protein NC653_041929 [Populus alba x Populus x berolinensis]
MASPMQTIDFLCSTSVMGSSFAVSSVPLNVLIILRNLVRVPSKNFKRLQSRKSHSWWWDSHMSPKNSKWHSENLEGELLISRCPFSFKDLLVEQKCA